jgi:hypothetical protein
MFELISSDAANDLLIKVFNFRERARSAAKEQS